MDALVEEFRTFPDHPLIHEGLAILSEKFSASDSVGPVFVTNFLDENDPETRAQIQRDAYERVQYLLNALLTWTANRLGNQKPSMEGVTAPSIFLPSIDMHGHQNV